MPRRKVESEKLTGRVSENYFDIEVVKFVRNKLKKMDQAELIREAIEVLWKYERGKLFKEDLEETITKVLKNNDMAIQNSKQEELEVDERIEEEIENELESQFDDDGNLNFHF